MARSRNVKPGLFTNDKLGEIPPLGRLLFIGLWCQADREGRLSDRPNKIKVEVLPYDGADVESLLAQLSDLGFIHRYEVEGEKYIQVVNFAKHQNPHFREKSSEIPKAPDKPQAFPRPAPVLPQSSPADSGFLIPDSLQKKEASPPKKKTINGTHRGTRLDADWGLELEDGKWAEQTFRLTPTMVMNLEAQFRDYWIAQPGQKGVKLDWPATWRNWVRRSQEGIR